MSNELEDQSPDDARLGRLLRERLPRYPPPAHLRAAIVGALAVPSWRRPWAELWAAPAAAALATAMIMILWIAPSLPTSPNDPIRLLANAMISEHARTILWGEPRMDVVPTALPRAMEESGVALNWVFTGDEGIQLINAYATYLEGRRGIELAYRDADGHTVTYVALPAVGFVLPAERGRVQIGRWRPLVRKENGFSFIIWKQQELLCVLVADLVSDADLGKLKDYFVKVRSSSEPYATY
jgi:hypothetical protein